MIRPRARDPRGDTAWLSAALRVHADEHEADLPRIEARFARLVTGDPRAAQRGRAERPLRPRLIGVPLGILAAAATAGIAVAVTLGIGDRPPHPASRAAAPPPATHTPADRPSAPPATLHPAGTASSRSDSSPTPSPSPSVLTASGTVDAHSTQYWAQEDLTVSARGAVKALHVTVAVSGGTTVRSTGYWSTILSQDLDATVRQTPTGLVYEFVLKPGQTLQPGTFAFGFQFGRPAGGHSFGLDAYTVTATAVEGAEQASATGGFAG